MTEESLAEARRRRADFRDLATTWRADDEPSGVSPMIGSEAGDESFAT